MHTLCHESHQHGRDVVNAVWRDAIGREVEHKQSLLLLSHSRTDIPHTLVLGGEREGERERRRERWRDGGRDGEGGRERGREGGREGVGIHVYIHTTRLQTQIG